jgi:hypothetical protein
MLSCDPHFAAATVLFGDREIPVWHTLVITIVFRYTPFKINTVFQQFFGLLLSQLICILHSNSLNPLCLEFICSQLSHCFVETGFLIVETCMDMCCEPVLDVEACGANVDEIILRICNSVYMTKHLTILLYKNKVTLCLSEFLYYSLQLCNHHTTARHLPPLPHPPPRPPPARPGSSPRWPGASPRSAPWPGSVPGSRS